MTPPCEINHEDSSSIFRLYIHTSTTFPWPPTSIPSKDASHEWSKTPNISSILDHLPTTERTAITRFYHPADASRSLSSHLLKHLSIIRGAQTRWSRSTISQEHETDNGKPFHAPGGVQFNVSHHGEYVVCVGTNLPGANVGIDIVQIDVQRDGPRIGTDGFERWVDIFADILSVDEREFVLVAERMEGLQAGLRAFYTVWACKEAFVKMTGDALMAGWLRELAFPGLRVPSTIATGNSDGVSRLWGDRVMTEVVLQGKVVEGVRIELVSLGNDYIVATAIDRGVALPEFELVRVSPDGGTLDCYLDMENMSRLLSYDMKD